jgi:ATP-binding cassette subfamily B protein
VIIAHRLSTIRHASWIDVLDRAGTVVERGTHPQLLDRAGHYACLWRLQASE